MRPHVAALCTLVDVPTSRGLRVAMVTEYAYPVLGGVSEHVHFLSRELVALGHEVTVVTGRAGSRATVADIDRRHELEDGYRTVRVGRSLPVPSNGSIARITVSPGSRRALRRVLDGMDVVHAQGLIGFALPPFAVNMSTAPVTVGTFHTYTEDGEYWAYRRFHRPIVRMLERLDRRIVVSDACVAGLAPHFGGDWDVIPNGVDCDRFRPLATGEARPDGPPVVLFVARLEPRNQLGDLIRAVALLRDRGRRVQLQVAGDGPTRDSDERLARKLGVADRIEWLGLIHDDLPRRYREATALAAPCTLASFGVILIEALASGTAVVCADNIGFRQVIRDGMPGRFVPMRDPSALAAGLEEVLADHALRTEWATRGRALTYERYDWSGVARRVSDVYAEEWIARRSDSEVTGKSTPEEIFGR